MKILRVLILLLAIIRANAIMAADRSSFHSSARALHACVAKGSKKSDAQLRFHSEAEKEQTKTER